MVKRIIIAVLILGAIGAGAAWYLMNRQEAMQLSNPAQAIPKDAALILRFPDFRATLSHFSETQYSHRLLELSNIKNIEHWGMRLDSLLDADPQMANIFGDAPWYVSYHFPEDKTSIPFYCHQLNSQPGPEQMKMFLDELFGSSATYSQHVLGDQIVYKAVFEEPFDMVQFCMMNGVLMISENDGLLSAAIDQLNNKSGLTETENFQDMLKVQGEHVDLNLFMPFDQTDDLMRPILKKNSMAIKQALGSIALQSQLDINFKEAGVMFNGFTFVEDSTDMMLNLLKGQEPQHLKAASILPANLVYLHYTGISDVDAFRRNQAEVRSARGILDSIAQHLDDLSENAEEDFYSWLGSGFGTSITAPRGNQFKEQTYFIVNTKSEEDALVGIQKMDETLGLNEAESSAINGIEIHETKMPSMLPALISAEPGVAEMTHFAIVDDHVIFGHGEAALRAYLRYIIADKELSKDLSYSTFTEHLGSRSNLFIYSKILPALPVLQKHLSYQTQGKMEGTEDWLGEFGSFGLQLSTNGQAFYTNAYLSYGSETIDDASSGRNCQLDTLAQTAPVFVTNHYNDELEVMVQDAKNQLYLFNLAGKELWKRQLDGPIRSEIHEVDAFKNRKFQFLFNTDDKIYLVDRKGNDVDGFPIELKAKAITPLCVANYDNKRDYRLVITCENNRIYNYSINGKVTRGWNHNKATDPTTMAFKHFSVSGKDYFVTAESNGKTHLLDRRGKNRVKVGKRIPSFSNNNFQIVKGKNASSSAVFCTDTSGVLYRISLSGKVSSHKLASMSSRHTFIATDLDNDGKTEFIFNDLNLLTIYNNSYEKVAELRVSPGTVGPFSIELPEGQNGVGIFNFEDGEINVLDHNLESISGFPMNGNGQFSLRQGNGDNSPVWVVTPVEGNLVSISALE